VTSVVLLAGGQGTRLRALSAGIPKPMIPVAGRPFVEWMLDYFASQGADHAVLSIGHLAEVVEHHFAGRPGIECVRETRPLGTGGALRFAAGQAPVSDPFFAANADSLAIAELGGLRRALEDAATDGALLAVTTPDASRFGTLDVGAGGWLRGFHEKRPGAGLINAGVYLFRRRLLAHFPPGAPLSLEQDVFPALLAAGQRLRVIPAAADFLDIGTPESFALAEKFIRRHFPAAAAPQATS